MQYTNLIHNRKSFREFENKKLHRSVETILQLFHQDAVHRLLPDLKTSLAIFGTEAREALEGAAGYHQFLVGAPQYLVLLSEKHELAHLNGGYIMEDLLLKLADLGLDSCWLTFTDSNDIKAALRIDSDLDVVAIAAFGYGRKTVKRLRLNIRSMSDVDIRAQYRYMEPKRSVSDLAFVDTWGNNHDLEQYNGFFDEVLWEALYAASLSPSYLKRQAYGFLLQGGRIHLVSRPDAYNTKIDGDLSLGAVLLHFTAVAENWAGKLQWQLDTHHDLQLPTDHKLIASTTL